MTREWLFILCLCDRERLKSLIVIHHFTLGFSRRGWISVNEVTSQLLHNFYSYSSREVLVVESGHDLAVSPFCCPMVAFVCFLLVSKILYDQVNILT